MERTAEPARSKRSEVCEDEVVGSIMVSIKRVFFIILSLLLLTSCTTVEGSGVRDQGSGDGSYEGDEGIRNSESGIRNEDGGIRNSENGIRNEDEGAEGHEGEAWRIRVVKSSGEEIWSFTEAELNNLMPKQADFSSHIYSTINNWPVERFYVAEGYRIESIFKMAGVLDNVQTATFRAADGYEVSLTREQLFIARYYFPQVGESAEGAEQVLPIISYRWKEGSTDLGELREDKPSLIFGQRNQFEHTNPAFIVGVSEIVIDEDPCETWALASTFPLPGSITEGETVKLQHQFYGLVKLHYTLDGSEPTLLSPMYNPSTYQSELNVPIPITEPTTIKVLVTGYGKNDSDIAEFEFFPVP